MEMQNSNWLDGTYVDHKSYKQGKIAGLRVVKEFLPKMNKVGGSCTVSILLMKIKKLRHWDTGTRIDEENMAQGS